MTRSVVFEVFGTPKPQGSKRHVGNGVMIEQGGEALRTWREDVKHAALAAREQVGQLDGAVWANVTFRLARPKTHYRSGISTRHLLRPNAPEWPITKPDLDKLLRSTFDAIGSAGLWRDDCQVVGVRCALTYAVNGSPPGAVIALESRDPTGADA